MRFYALTYLCGFTGQDLSAWQTPTNYTGLQDLGRFLRFISRNRGIIVSYNTIQGIALNLMILRTLWLASLVMQQASTITSTLMECAGYLLDLSVVFFIITIGIAMVGYTSFGHRSKTLSTFETGYTAVAEFSLALNSGGKSYLVTRIRTVVNKNVSFLHVHCKAIESMYSMPVIFFKNKSTSLRRQKVLVVMPPGML